MAEHRFTKGEERDMSTTMADEKVRLVMMVDPDIRAGLRLEAARRDLEMSELVGEILAAALTDAIEEIRRNRGQNGKGKKHG
jgi:hypothetical protein